MNKDNITYRVHGYWLGPIITEWSTDTEEDFEKYCKTQKFKKDDKGIYRNGNSYLEIKSNNLKTAYMYGTKHGMPAVTLIDEDGYVVASHGGDTIEDAEMWFNHFQKGKDYNVIRVDQELVNKHIYEGEPITILPEGLIKAFRLNQQHKGIRNDNTKNSTSVMA